MSNPKQIYNDFVRANLPSGMTYDSTRNRYVVNGKYQFPTYLQAKWYLDYITKFGFETTPAGFTVNGFTAPWGALFAENEYRANGASSTLANALTTTRASTATYVDSSGTLQTAAAGELRVGHHVWDGSAWVNKGALVEEQATNLLLNSATLSTQNVTVTAEAHTLHFTGTGTVTLSGASTAGPLVGTGTGENNRVSLSFTPTAGTLTLTVSGTVSNAQLETDVQTSYIPTTGSQATRAADVLVADAAKLPWSGTAMSLVIEGEVTYADNDTLSEVRFFRWEESASRRFGLVLNTSDTKTGTVQAFQVESGVFSSVEESAPGSLSPGVNQPFSLASTFGTDLVALAVNGTSLTPDTDTTAIADLENTALQIASTFNGTISRVLVIPNNIGDTGREEPTS